MKPILTILAFAIIVFGAQAGRADEHVSAFDASPVQSTSGEAGTLAADPEFSRPARGVEEGREFRLKVRELADRLVEADAASISGKTIVPVSFVSVDSFERSSSFGKLVCEQLISEFSGMGMRVKEYRIRTAPQSRPGSGEFMLTRSPMAQPSFMADDLVLAGTYYFDEDNVYVNARLFTALDGMVVSAASMVLPQSFATRTMLARGGGLSLAPAETGVKAFVDEADLTGMGFLFSEEDLH